MIWQGRILILMLVGIPAFTGVYPLSGLGDALPGVTWSAFIYAAAVNLAVGLTCGGTFAAGALAVSVLILLPVVIGGAAITWCLAWLASPSTIPADAHGGHYVRLALNMLSVIPLALSIVATIPFGRLEQHLLRSARGVASWEKKVLMAVRVFNHITFFVIPNLLEVVREERPFESRGARWRNGVDRKATPGALMAVLVQIGVAGICAALRFIPLWAREIADLPDREIQQNRRSR
ncbi:MAG: hypothetical protein QNJ48_03025 [Desulfobacterales bacterium]|nr:hypothetical protein [Desulfobacterales bacterium]MDJ0873805.1 hypothetical protein [Desulfobacterales bacterium]MDJ0883101.1 hypothetical protein [Desulfobacterales bacterium]